MKNENDIIFSQHKLATDKPLRYIPGLLGSSQEIECTRITLRPDTASNSVAPDTWSLPSLLTAGRGCLRPLWLWKNDIGQNYGNYSFIVIKPTTTVCSRENLTLPWYFPTSYLQHSTAGISRNDWRLSSVYENKEQLINRTVWTELVSFCIWISLLSREIEWNLFLRCWDWCSWRLPGKLDNLPFYLRLY